MNIVKYYIFIVRNYYKIVYNTVPLYVAYKPLDIILCSTMGLPSIIYFFIYHNWFMLVHGISIGILSILADGLQISRLILFDRIGAVITFVIWFVHGIYFIPDMSIWFAIYEILIVSISLISQQLAIMYFYYKKDSSRGVFYQRMWHIGAFCSMTSVILYRYSNMRVKCLNREVYYS